LPAANGRRSRRCCRPRCKVWRGNAARLARNPIKARRNGQWRTMSRVPERNSFGCAGSPTCPNRDRGPLDPRICRPGESRGHRYIVGSSLTSESGSRRPGTASEGTSPIRHRGRAHRSPLRSGREDRHRSAPRRRASAGPPRPRE
jgi:hypothetical protein